MKISIRNNRIHKKTYKKPMNLHLYIKNRSTHLHCCLKGIIDRMILRYYKLNSEQKDFLHCVKNLYKRTIKRGNNKDKIKDIIFSETAKVLKITQKTTTIIITLPYLSYIKLSSRLCPIERV